MKEEKSPYPFEMPVNRLLTESEYIDITSNGLISTKIKCKACANEGFTTDGRKFCSIKCYCMEHVLDFNSIKLIEKAIYLNEAAYEGDVVIYSDCIMSVVATDCTKQRIKRAYNMKFNYVLKHEGKLIKISDLDTPLRKIGFGFNDESVENEYYE